MTVSARSATKLPQTAIDPPGEADGDGFVDMRGASPVRAGTYPYDGLDETSDLVTGWHTHDLHQIEYAFEGVVEVETETAHYLLPPQQAVWIPAGLRHRTTLKRVRTVSVFFEPDMVPDAGDRARVLAALPVMREMIVYGARWPISRATSDPVADAYFDALALLTTEWLEHETPLCLPASTEPVVAAVMAYTQDHLRGVTEREVCRAVGVSERTLRRQFAAATGISWRRYLLVSRLLRAMALLAEPGTTVLRVATDVGFDSVSAFTRAFRRYTGETPTAYRRRIATDRIATDRITTGT
jgi:AraC-like DNA-binding protein/mannose-6-phosphate isomerase-like protein (cupin superfamily)